MITSFFQRLATFIDWIKKMINPSNVKQALNIDILASQPMTEALEVWANMYVNQASWLNNDPIKPIKSLGLPSAIANEIARLTTIEMAVDMTGSARATYIKAIIDDIVEKLKIFIEYGGAKGGLVLKPYLSNGKIAYDFVQADQFYPVSFDNNRSMTGVIFNDQRRLNGYYYTRLEYHKFEDNQYYIKNSVFRSTSKESLGNEVPFESVPEWADLEPEATIAPVEAPLFGYFAPPLANTIDPTSPLGVSWYSRAVDLIEQADKQWSNLIWEFRSGERAIYVDPTAFEQGADGKPKLPDNRLYRTLQSTSQIGEGKLFDEWTPEFRDASIRSGLNDILKRIEFNCGLAYGTLSDPQNIERTATEIAAAKQRSASTIVDNQKALEECLEQTIYAIDVWVTIGGLASSGGYKVTYEFDDSIVSDHDSQFQQDFQVAGANMMPDYIFLMRNYGLSEAVAKQWVAEKQAESARAMSLFDNPTNNQSGNEEPTSEEAPENSQTQ